MACNHELQAQGNVYPRTCQDCGLGPCKLGYKLRPATHSVWLLWAQYSDCSGEQMIRVFADEGAAVRVKEMMEAASPSMEIKITEVPFEATP